MPYLMFHGGQMQYHYQGLRNTSYDRGFFHLVNQSLCTNRSLPGICTSPLNVPIK